MTFSTSADEVIEPAMDQQPWQLPPRERTPISLPGLQMQPWGRHGTRFLLPVVLVTAGVPRTSGAHSERHDAYGFRMFVPTPAASRVTDGDTAPAPPSRAARSAFRQANRTLNDAADAGDWDVFLAAAGAALAALPEESSSYAKRSRVATRVGEWSVALRREDQVRRAIEILARYVEELRSAYGDDTRESWRSEPAHVHLDALRRRLAGFASPRSSSPRFQPRIPIEAPTPRLRRERARPLVASGALLTAVGATLSIAGVVVHGYASSLDRQESSQARSVGATPLALIAPGAAALVIGIGLLAAGLDARRRNPRPRASVEATRLWIRF